MQSTQLIRVKILLRETDETFLVPQPLEELEFDALISFIKAKISKAKNYEVLFVALPKSLLMENEDDFLRYKASVISRGEKSVKFLVQEFGANVEEQSIRKGSKDSDKSDKSASSDWKFQCQGGHHANYSGTLFQCAVCADYFVCEKCEGKGFHEVHPLIRIHNRTQYKVLQSSKQGKLQKIVEQFKNSNPLKNIQQKFNQLGKLFCESDKKEQEDSEAYILKMKSTLLGSMLDSEPEKFTQLVQENPDKDVESLVQMVLQAPQKFGLGL